MNANALQNGGGGPQSRAASQSEPATLTPTLSLGGRGSKASPSNRPAPALDTPVQFLPGVGPKRAAALEKLGVRTLEDLVLYFPFRHERCVRTTIADLQPDVIGTVVGRVKALHPRAHHRGPSLMATVADNTERCSVTWFNAPYVLDKLRPGAVVRLTGKVREYRGLPQFINPQVQVLDEQADPLRTGEHSSLEPVYPATAALNSNAIGKLVSAALPLGLPLIDELLPAEHVTARRMWTRRVSIERLHHPREQADVDQARKRLAYDELFLMQLAVSLARRHRTDALRAAPLPSSPQIDQRIRKRLPFVLTAAQDRAIAEIVADLARDRPMNRLLQGDVGCGKTAAAVYAALVAAANRKQTVVLAPTELLAEQHHRNIAALLAGSRVRLALWTGGGTKSRRAELRLAAATGEVDLVVGTHALLEDDIEFQRLGLVIVDEQHRFGVRQRAAIRSKGAAPHYLVMTATPIPRTLAMTVFGDMDVSTIDALPPGRAPVRTKVVQPNEFDHAWQFIRSRIAKGEQAFVVYPLVDESDKVPLRSAVQEAETLSKRSLAGCRVALLHGRMKPAEKDAVMHAFSRGEADVLAATTVIEVGIDVPNATVMAIQHADRYGLAQLHQLRGRVGRGGRPGYCYLMSDSRDARDNARLAVLTRTTDGFKIAEEDLKLRGPGELLGVRQHGMPVFRVADLLRDIEILRLAQKDAADIVRRDPLLQHAEWQRVRRVLLEKYAERMGFLVAG